MINGMVYWWIALCLGAASVGVFLIKFYKDAEKKVNSASTKQVLQEIDNEIKKDKENN